MDEPVHESASGPDRVEAFWNVARFHAKLNPAPTYFGPTTLEMLPPPAWAFGESAVEADAALADLLDCGTATMSAPLVEYGDELPQAGTLAIVLDSVGVPQALVETSDVSITDGTVTEVIRVVYAA